MVAESYLVHPTGRSFTCDLLPPANEVLGKVIFLHLFVILFTGGACVVGRGAYVVAQGMHGCRGLAWLWETYMVDSGHVWLGGMRSCGEGACMGYNEIQSMSGWYASYWNAFLFIK